MLTVVHCAKIVKLIFVMDFEATQRHIGKMGEREREKVDRYFAWLFDHLELDKWRKLCYTYQPLGDI